MKKKIGRLILFLSIFFVIITITLILLNIESILSTLTAMCLSTFQAYQNFPKEWIISALVGIIFMAAFDRVVYTLTPRKKNTKKTVSKQKQEEISKKA